MGKVIFQHWEYNWLALVAMAVGLALVWRGYRRSPLGGARKWLAAGCKAAVVLLLGLLLLDPQWSREVPRKGANEVVLAADNGAGLNVADKTGGISRGEQMKRALTGSAALSWIDQLEAQFRVRSMVFDDRLRGVKDFSELKFDGNQSALCSSARSLSERGGASPTAAVVVFTDGIATDVDAWRTVSGEHAPVFPVVVGSGPVDRDLALGQVIATQTAFEESPVTIQAGLRAAGFAGQTVALLVLDEAGKVVAKETHRFDRSPADHQFRIRVTSARTGLSFFRVVALTSGHEGRLQGDEWKKSAGEATVENNERLLAVDRGAGPYRVLYIAGRPNWEYKFLRRALAGDVDIQMPSLVRIARREPKFEWRGRTGETTNPLFRGFRPDATDEAQRYDQPVWIRLGMRDKQELMDGFPKAAEELFGEFRAVIIDDIEAEAFTQEQMNLIERFVSQRGGALLMLGGQECFRAGGYEHSPVGRMLPVYLDRLSGSGPIEDVRFNLTREGWLEPWLRLRARQEEEEARLAQMPAFFAVNPASSIKPGASIVATAADASQTTHPALVVQRFGEGRVAAVLIGDLWRWGMESPEKHADMDKAWRQLMRWLVVDVPDRVTLEAQPSKPNGQAVVAVQVRARDSAFRAVDDAIIKITLEQPGGAKVELFAEPSSREPGLFEAEYYPRGSGAHRIKAEVRDGKGQLLGEKQTGWVSAPLAEEFRSLEPDRALLERIAKDTGGRVIELGDLPSLPRLLQNLNVPIKQTVTDPLWHSPWVFALILALLAAEWIIRRRAGWV